MSKCSKQGMVCKMENEKIIAYKSKRDACQVNGNKFLAAFYQLFIVQETKKRKFSFYKKNDLKQHWILLRDMLSNILEISDENFQISICYEVILAEMGRRLTGEEEQCHIYRHYFHKSENCKYVHGVYQLHLNIILRIADSNIANAQLYADNLLTLLELRFGIYSWQYAKMKLHIIGEFLYRYNRDAFLYEVKKNYNYFEQYTADCDFFFCEVLGMYTYFMIEKDFRDYKFWMSRCENALEKKQGDKLYCFLKCKTAWIKAKALEKQNEYKAIFDLMQETIIKYLTRDCNNKNLFYGYVYLMAAFACYKLQDYNQMYCYAKDGIAICENMDQIGSEVYYNLYYYIGIMHMVQADWGNAEKLYFTSLQDIVQKFGTDNENYVLYLSNLTVTALNQGKNIVLYEKKLNKIKKHSLRRKYISVFNNALNFSIAQGMRIKKIKSIYLICLKNIEDIEDEQERNRLDTLYLSAKVNNGIFDDETRHLVENLGITYKNNYSNEIAITYWNSILVLKWNEGDIHVALEISERLKENISIQEFKYIPIVTNYIQLLVICGQYSRARAQIFSAIDMLENMILKTGFGNNTFYLYYIRILLSMYIYMIKRNGNNLWIDEESTKQLIEKIMFCKTIEREISSLLGSYKNDNEQMDLYYFKQAHRKLATLEMGLQVGNLGNEDYERRKSQCLYERSVHGSNLSKIIPFFDIIHRYKFDDIELPDNSICIEYFAYYRFVSEMPMSIALGLEDEEPIHNYLAIVLSKDKENIKIQHVIDIPLEEALDKEECCLLEASQDAKQLNKEDIERIIKHLNQLFAMPFQHYLLGKEVIYLGLDFVLQILPMDIIFYKNGIFPNIIMVDAACYVGKDTQINIENSNALVIGNPLFNIHVDKKEHSLPYGELECKIIAKMFGTEPYIGKDAKQKVLWEKEPKDIIHISTHGEWKDIEQNVLVQDNLIISSYLKFAGFSDWEKGNWDKEYGNGIVTGDDFQFMNLSHTKLIVLSACVSGIGHFKGLSSVRGLRWAIGVAGAKNSITTLWEVPDVSSAILMILFYRNLHIMSVGKALYEAKKRLRTITVGELKKDNELRQIIEETVKKETDDNVTPYEHWKNWAGFVCYHG